MRTILIAAAAAAIVAVPAAAQVAGHGPSTGGAAGSHWGGGGGERWGGGGMHGGGSWSGGGWSGGGAATSAQGGAGGWSGRSWQGGRWNGGRWGQTVDGRWWGGARAPGGWSAYRRPYRGWRMPGYWRSGEWAIGDWQFYGLQAPPYGYGWSRYYDDAVLVDGDGYVRDSVDGVDWRRGDDYDRAGPEYYEGRDGRCYDTGRRRDRSGIGGALVGGAIGAGIGAATGGLGAILLGGGLGALGGQAIDRDSSRRSGIVCDGPDYRGAGYDGYGYYDYARGPVATVTVEFEAPVVTTTTTTVTEKWVSAHRTVRKPIRRWRPKSKLIYLTK